VIGGADRSKAIIVLNPAEPPLMMTNTIYALVKNPNEKKITESVNDIIREVQSYVPGYRLRVPPVYDGNKVTVIIEVEGAGDFLPSYSGNLDIINQAAVAVADKLAAKMLGGN
jgi:acetaldehyde dehydrogenase